MEAATQQRIHALVDAVSAPYETARPMVSVTCRSERGTIADIDGSAVHAAASTMKVPIMVELFRAIDRGRMSLGDRVEVVNRFASVADGTTYCVSPPDDADFALYRYQDRSVTIRFLLERMIGWSSNLATNLLFALIDRQSLAATMTDLGLFDTTVARGIEDRAAAEAGLANSVTAADLTELLLAILRERAAGPASCQAMLGHLSRQRWNDEVPAGLPPETLVAHKTGWLDGVLHDAALVFPPDGAPYALTVLTSGVKDGQVARQLIQRISAAMYAQRSDF